MAYDLTALTDKAMCDRALALAQPVHDDLTFQLSQVGRHTALTKGGATTTDAHLDAATAEVTALTASIAAMAAGVTRDKYARKLRRATERVSQLTDRASDFDGAILTDNEFDKRRLTQALTETTTYMAEVTARKAALPS